jgi:hypothetical protein
VGLGPRIHLDPLMGGLDGSSSAERLAQATPEKPGFLPSQSVAET